jgi:serine/threonine protein kinase
MASYLNITNKLLEPLDKLSYLAAKDSGAKAASKKTQSQCQKVSDCKMIDKALSLYDKACTVELECLDGLVKDSNTTRTYFGKAGKRCELELKIWSHYYFFVIAGVTILVLVVVVVLLSQKSFRVVLYSMDWISKIFPDEKDDDLGIFIVHVDDDLKSFVCLKDTLEGINKGRILNKKYLRGRTYKSLYHERDFIPGVLIPENIKRCITKSSRVLIILTPTLLKSDWCREEFYFANLYEKAIVIKMKLNGDEESELQTLLTLNANKTIDNHLKSHTYIKWNGLGNDADFWKKLAYSLPHKKAELPSVSFVTLMKRMFRCRTRLSLDEENPLLNPYTPNIVHEDFNETEIISIAFMQDTKCEEIEHIIDGVNVIGKGGYGEVFRGKWKGQYVAIKKLHEHNTQANQDLMNELKSMCYPAQNILPLLSFCLNPPCLISQYMENGSLRRKLEDHKNPLSWAQRLNIALGISSGLRHLHEHNIVHGDIKSDNILLDKHLEPKIGDFGSARFLYSDSKPEETEETKKTITHIVVQHQVGTESYLPKWYKTGRTEVAVRKPVDTYSFGIVLLEILSDRLVSTIARDQETLRDFIDNHIEKFDERTTFENEYPSEYITQADDEHKKFIENDPKCCEDCAPLSLPYVFYLIGSLCTQTGTQPATAKPPPWKSVPEIEEINESIEHHYDCYHLKYKVTEDEIVKSSLVSSRLVSQDG